MNLRLENLWHWNGTLDRGTYAIWGCLLFALKYNLDRLIAWLVFKRSWSIFSYFRSDGSLAHLALQPADAAFLATMLACALPFIYVGVVLTLRRLRDAGLPIPLVALFFVPLVNLIFFLALALVPSSEAAVATQGARWPRWRAAMPQSQLGSAALALLLTTLGGFALVQLAVSGLREYGIGLFVGLPFALGLVSVLIYGFHGKRTLGACLSVALLSVGLLGLGLLAGAVEGCVCLVMAAPLALPLAALGGTVGYFIQAGHGGRATPQIAGVLLLFLPVLMGAESLDGTPPPLCAVASTVEIDAPPATVWKNVVSFSTLPAPHELLFRTGIAYPVRASIRGQGVGAVRRCEFTTGPFVEPITVWDAPHRLAFDVSSEPRSLDELSPWGPIAAPHIEHFFVSERGEFLLTALPGGRTRLTGTTWYRHRIWPSTYWQPWSDAILHTIHARVLAHVKNLSEARPAALTRGAV